MRACDRERVGEDAAADGRERDAPQAALRCGTGAARIHYSVALVLARLVIRYCADGAGLDYVSEHAGGGWSVMGGWECSQGSCDGRLDTLRGSLVPCSKEHIWPSRSHLASQFKRISIR